MDTPSEILTFLFTDIEGSTRLWERFPDAMPLALARHDALLRQAIERNSGVVFKTVGDAFCAVFTAAADAARAAVQVQVALPEESWGETGPILVRAALHSGPAERRDNDYFGPTLNRVARLLSLGSGQQILLSSATCALVPGRLPDDASLLDLGLHRLKDLSAPEHVWQLVDPSLPASFPPLRSLDCLPTNLPQQLTSFVGRETEMETVKDLLKKARLLTLTGSGGTGKTRLALQVGAEVVEDYADGVWLVDLAPLSDPGLVAQAVAAVLDVREEPGRHLVETLVNRLKDKSLLLILDNCEHLLGPVASLADSLLKQCGRIAVLATSREALGITGELRYRVPSLSLPSGKQAPRGDALRSFEAVQLFLERAFFQQPSFALSDRNAPAILSLCKRLDGIPLAIELAAARVRAMPVEQIEARLEDRFRLLTGGSRTALPRQQTLRGLLDWSYDLLNEQEKTFLHRLSVFAGGWTLRAAEAVCSGDGIEDWEVLDVLLSLTDKSLVIYDETGNEAGEGRYRLLETVRQYAAAKLETRGEAEPIRSRHLGYFSAIAKEASEKLRGVEQAEWLRWLETDHDNLRASLGYGVDEASEASRAELGLEMAVALDSFWHIHGHFAEGRSWLERTLARNENAPGEPRARALGTLGRLRIDQADFPAAQSLFEEALALREGEGDTREVAALLSQLGEARNRQGDYPAANALFERALDIYRKLEDKPGIASNLGNLANVAFNWSDYTSARAWHTEALALQRTMGNGHSIARTLTNLAVSLRELGEYDLAKAACRESLAIQQGLEDRYGAAQSIGCMGTVALREGDLEKAKELFEESVVMHREIGSKRGIANGLHSLGRIARMGGDYESAVSFSEESLALFRETGDRWGEATLLLSLSLAHGALEKFVEAHKLNLEALALFHELKHIQGVVLSLEARAALCADQGLYEVAARIWGVSERIREDIHSPFPPGDREKYDRQVAEARQALGEAAFSSGWSAGREMTLEQAIASVLVEQKQS